ncbi:MAG: hypothetical protein C0502_01735 [Opitutus sp.]|nr:hypothetical protein [Opitutus sp.]
MKRHSHLLFSLCLVLLTGVRAATPGDSPQVLPLRPYIVAGWRLLEMNVNGVSGQFVFDTAGGLTLITPEFARALGLKPAGQVTGFRHTGERIIFPLIPVQAVSVGGRTLARNEVAQFDLMKLLEGAPPLQGIVGLDLFDGTALTIDFGGDRVIAETDSSLAARVRDMQPVQIRPARGSGGASLDIFMAAASPQGTLWLELDSGNAGPVLLSPHAAEQLGIKPGDQPAATTLHLPPATGYACTVSVKETIYDGLIDAAFFNQHVVTLDLKNMRAWIKRNEPAPQTR